MSRCSKTTTTRPGSKLLTAKHVVRQRLQPNLSPGLSSSLGLEPLISPLLPPNLQSQGQPAEGPPGGSPSGPGPWLACGSGGHLSSPRQRLDPWAEDYRRGRVPEPPTVPDVSDTESPLPDGPMDFSRTFLFTFL